eukprot:Pgem_evm1s6555
MLVILTITTITTTLTQAVEGRTPNLAHTRGSNQGRVRRQVPIPPPPPALQVVVTSDKCKHFFEANTKNVCGINGYKRKSDKDTPCSNLRCTVTACCNGVAPTCNDHFNAYGGPNICVTKGFTTPRPPHTRCSDGNCNSPTCCDGMRTCRAFFLMYDKKFCERYGYLGAKSGSTVCAVHNSCTLNDCCHARI